MKRVNVGGQAVLEGVMMKCEDRCSVAVRKPDKEIACVNKRYKSFSDKCKLFKLPIFRGMLAFVESMKIGVQTLLISADFFEDEAEANKEPGGFEKFLYKVFKSKTEAVVMGFSVLIAICLSIGLFIILPALIMDFLKGFVDSRFLRNLFEGLIRITFFLIYVVAISMSKDIKRVYQYHGAEHKTINCLEHEEELTVENVMKHSRLHKRCGTSFMLIVMVISFFFFMLITTEVLWMKIVSRLILIPFVAGTSYEFLKLAGRSENPIINFLAKPGLAMQRITTKEPDGMQIEVAIRAVQEVLKNEEFEVSSDNTEASVS